VSFNSTYRKFQSMNAHQIRDEGNAIVRNIARRGNAKTVARSANITPRHVYNLREEIGQPELSWSSFILLAQTDDVLREAVHRWLDGEMVGLESKKKSRAHDLPESLDTVFMVCMEIDPSGALAAKVYRKFHGPQNEAAKAAAANESD